MNSKDRSNLIMPAQRGISRRRALKIGAATASIIIATPMRGFAATPSRGGHLKYAAPESSANDSLDPTSYVSTYMMLAGFVWGNTLFTVDDNMKIVPELAEGAEPSPDAKKWVIKLRQGVTYHNGKAMTADDVVWCVNRHRAKEAASGMGPLLDQIVEVKATATNEVAFELKAGNADWPYVLSDYHLVIQPKGDPTNTGVSTGPYIVEKFEPGVRLTAKRNPSYFRSDAAFLDSVELIGINDPMARISALQTGDIDLLAGIPPSVVSMLQGAFDVHRGHGTGFSEFVFHSKEAPFNNNDLRLALKYAVDRKEMLEKVSFGNGELANDHPIPSFFRYHASGLEQKAYDPDKAKFHYKKSGHSGPLPAMAAAPTHYEGGGLQAAELFQQQAQRAGIQIDVERVPDDGYWANVWNNRPLFESGWFGRPTEDQMLTSAFRSGGSLNETQMESPKVDELLLSARSELNEDKRRQQYQDIQEIIAMEGGSILPYFTANLAASTKKVQGFSQNPLGDGKFVERVYLAS